MTRDPVEYFADWPDYLLARRLEPLVRDGQTFSDCVFGCGNGARGGGPCVDCIRREVERRKGNAGRRVEP